MMNQYRKISVLFALSFFALLCNAQTGLQMKLQLLPGGGSWGVYVKPVGITPSGNLLTASGQVTVVMPLDFEWEGLFSVSGQWVVNSNINGPDELPDRKIISFGLVQAEPLFPIPIAEGEETLLFQFSSDGPCPDTLYLIDCITVLTPGPTTEVCPFCPEYDDDSYPNNDSGTNPGNDMGMLDIGATPPQVYNFEGNYGLSAWNCHDCDDDGILDAFDDEYSCSNREKLNLKLIYNSVYKLWSIMATPGTNFLPTENSSLESARLTIVSSDDFKPSNIQSINGGGWELINEVEENGTRYFTFELEADLEPIGFENGQEVKLFQFKNELGNCPASLSILEGDLPADVHANELNGTSTEDSGEVEFGLGNIYGPNAWQCEIIIGGGFGLDMLGTGNPVEKMLISPNPTSGFVDVKMSGERTGIQSTIKLVSLQGQTLQTHFTEGQNTLRMDLNQLPAGLYILTFERNGQVVQREKLIKE